MCGIVGIIGDFHDPEHLLGQMMTALIHRGPDQSGVFTDRASNVYLGHRRLSVLDVSENGRQPMMTENTVVVLNGEIYNFKQLREELARSYNFRSTSDTEVLLYGYEEWGIEKLLLKIKGMFAFAIYDRKKNCLHLARDRMGEKPLYYYHEPGHGFAFASELKSFQFIDRARKINEYALDLYFTFGYVPAPLSIIENVRKLKPGCRLFLDVASGRCGEIKYWGLTRRSYGQVLSENDAIEELQHRIEKSLDISMVSDVPLGIFLSGGLDSSLLCAFVCQKYKDIRTFSVVYDDPSFDESYYSRQVSCYLGTNHTELSIGSAEIKHVVTKLDKLVDEPLADMSLVPTHILAQKAREHVTVVLGGDGADELFCGYPTHLAHKLSSYYTALPETLRKGIIEKIIHWLPVSHKDFSLEFQLKRFVSSADLSPCHRHFFWQAHIPLPERSALYQRWFDSQKNFDSAVAENINDKATIFELIEDLDIAYYLPNDILAKVDIAAMACSLETRSPYLDHELVEFAYCLPERMKFRFRKQKYILKKLGERFLPKSIIYRKKHGFGAPIGKWLRFELHDYARDMLLSQILPKAFPVNRKYLVRLLDEHRRGDKDNRKQIWSLLVIANWLKSYGIA